MNYISKKLHDKDIYQNKQNILNKNVKFITKKF